MRNLLRPDFDVEETFELCISRIRSTGLKSRLSSITGDVVAAADEFFERATNGQLYLFPEEDNVAEVVTADEMVGVYGRMSGKRSPGRSVYDSIMLRADDDICPFCGHGVVSTLDHFLPKRHFPVLAVTPDNLVASCKDCNHAKKEDVPESANNTFLHPYFDEVSAQCWLRGQVVEGHTAAVDFTVVRQAAWSAELNDRVENQFSKLGLRRLYSKQAARLISGHRLVLATHHNSGGLEAVRSELTSLHASWSAYHLNCWQAAAFGALARSDWYCDTGHAL